LIHIIVENGKRWILHRKPMKKWREEKKNTGYPSGDQNCFGLFQPKMVGKGKKIPMKRKSVEKFLE